MRRRIAIATLAIVAAAAGGTALASPGGPFHDRADHQAQLAKDLAHNLDGVTAAEVQRALAKVREQRIAEHHAELAKDLASRLDGVSADEVERALEKAWREHHLGDGPPNPRDFVQTLASELDQSEAEIRRALQEVRRAHVNERLDAAVKAGRLTEQQADRIREHVQDGWGWHHRGPGPGMGGRGGPGSAPPGGAPAPF